MKLLTKIALLSGITILTMYVFSTLTLAQEATPAPTAVFPWEQNAVVVVIVNTVLGILQKVMVNPSNPVLKGIKWLVDLMSANVAHPK